MEAVTLLAMADAIDKLDLADRRQSGRQSASAWSSCNVVKSDKSGVADLVDDPLYPSPGGTS